MKDHKLFEWRGKDSHKPTMKKGTTRSDSKKLTYDQIVEKLSDEEPKQSQPSSKETIRDGRAKRTMLSETNGGKAIINQRMIPGIKHRNIKVGMSTFER